MTPPTRTCPRCRRVRSPLATDPDRCGVCSVPLLPPPAPVPPAEPAPSLFEIFDAPAPEDAT